MSYHEQALGVMRSRSFAKRALQAGLEQIAAMASPGDKLSFAVHDHKCYRSEAGIWWFWVSTQSIGGGDSSWMRFEPASPDDVQSAEDITEADFMDEPYAQG